MRVSGAGAVWRAQGRRSADRRFAEGGGCGAEARSAAGLRVAALQLGRLWRDRGRRALFTNGARGAPWPLLTGERAHYELAAGKDIAGLIASYERFATPGQMLPEQVWDDGDIPEHGLYAGKPAGSATPLVWAHAEYLKLLRSALDGKVFDRVDLVYERYCRKKGGARCGGAWRFQPAPADSENERRRHASHRGCGPL